jgi:Ran GTPase-activating protein (RanGAP) involved in mRNA processing and transport
MVLYKNLFRWLLGIFAVVFQMNYHVLAEESQKAHQAIMERSQRRTDSSSKSSKQNFNNGNNTFGEELSEEANYFPFMKVGSKISSDKVVGMCIKEKNIVFLGMSDASTYVYYEESLKEDEDFSDLNFFREYPRLVSVEINGLKLTIDMLENIQKLLPASIKCLIVDSCAIESENFELLSDIIKKHKQLASIKIRLPKSSVTESNVILQSIAGHAQMKFIGITLGAISSESCEYLNNVIAHSTETLEELTLGWNSITVGDDAESDKAYREVMKSMAETKQLKKLEFSVMSLSESSATTVFEALGDLKHLTNLKIFIDNLAMHKSVKLFENMEVLRDSLQKLPNLETFDISSMNLSGHEMQVLMQAISYMSKLKTLDVSGNVLDQKSAETLSESLQEHYSVTELRANDCSMDDVAFNGLCKSLSNTSLINLFLRGNKIKEGAKNLPLKSMPDLMLVDFAQNDMNCEDAMAFVELTKDQSNLHIVNFKGNSGIDAMSNIEKTIKNDQLTAWKLKNKNTVSFFGF